MRKMRDIPMEERQLLALTVECPSCHAPAGSPCVTVGDPECAGLMNENKIVVEAWHHTIRALEARVGNAVDSAAWLSIAEKRSPPWDPWT